MEDGIPGDGVMPKLRMPPRQQEIYDELVSSVGGARMMSLRQIAEFWGRDDRAARKWVQEKKVPVYDLNGIGRYAARDVAKAIYLSEQ